MPCSADELFAWHLRPGAFLRLAPPWEQVQIEHWAPPSAVGETAIIRMRLAPLVWKRWYAQYREFEPGRLFRDVQTRGPFAEFDHRHRMIPTGPASSLLEDDITYRPPLGWLGERLGGRFIRRSLDNLFAYRHRTTHDDLEAHARAASGPLHVLVSGSTGLVGSSLVSMLTAGGHEATRLSRRTFPCDERVLTWDDLVQRAGTDRRDISSAARPFDAIVHLAGENIAARRWSPAQKARLRDSRVEGTRRISEWAASLPRPPQTLVCASAIGIYGDRGDELLDENSTLGDDFLAGVGREWEDAAQAARHAGIRVVHLRFGIILSARGGALAKMRLPFLMGGGGRIGSGRQFMSWVALDDAVGAIHHALLHPHLAGAVNVVAPNPVTNSTFTRVLGQVLRRPTWAPLPGWAARLAFGEMADALLLSSQRVVPERLAAAGYRFRFPDLDEALRFQLGRIDG